MGGLGVGFFGELGGGDAGASFEEFAEGGLVGEAESCGDVLDGEGGGGEEVASFGVEHFADEVGGSHAGL